MITFGKSSYVNLYPDPNRNIITHILNVFIIKSVCFSFLKNLLIDGYKTTFVHVKVVNQNIILLATAKS